MPREMIKNVVSEWMAAQTDDNNKTRSLLDATQQISLKQPFMHGLILIPYPYHMIMYNQKLGEGYSFFKYRAWALHIEFWV